MGPSFMLGRRLGAEISRPQNGTALTYLSSDGPGNGGDPLLQQPEKHNGHTP